MFSSRGLKRSSSLSKPFPSSLAAPFRTAPRVLELGTGSGAIAISLAKEVKDIFVVATDISREALVLAKENALRAGVQRKIAFVNGDLFSPLQNSRKEGPFDLIVSNPPYVTRSEIGRLAREVRKEPRIALDGGEDGLDFYRSIISQAPSYLQRGGWLLLEMGQGQGPEVFSTDRREGRLFRPSTPSRPSGNRQGGESTEKIESRESKVEGGKRKRKGISTPCYIPLFTFRLF